MVATSEPIKFPQGSGAHGRGHANGQAQHNGDDERGDGQLRGSRQPRHQFIPHGRLGMNGPSQVQAQQATHVDGQLLRQRLVQSQVVADRLQGLRVGVIACHEAGGIAGSEMQNREDDHHNQDRRRHRPSQAPNDKTEHIFLSCP
jgi:hypothetical protein